MWIVVIHIYLAWLQMVPTKSICFSIFNICSITSWIPQQWIISPKKTQKNIWNWNWYVFLAFFSNLDSAKTPQSHDCKYQMSWGQVVSSHHWQVKSWTFTGEIMGPLILPSPNLHVLFHNIRHGNDLGRDPLPVRWLFSNKGPLQLHVESVHAGPQGLEWFLFVCGKCDSTTTNVGRQEGKAEP